MHGKLRAMVSGLVRFMLLHVPFCVHLFVCEHPCAGGQYLKGQTFYFSPFQRSQAVAGSVTFSL